MGFWSKLFGKKTADKEINKTVCPVCNHTECCCHKEVNKAIDPVVKAQPAIKSPTKTEAPKTTTKTARNKPAPKGEVVEPVVVTKPPKTVPTVNVTREHLEKMSKMALDEYAESLGIKLDRRARKQIMVETFLTEWERVGKQ